MAKHEASIDPSEIEISRDLALQLLDEVDSRYGPNGTVKPLAYHNRAHSELVWQEAKKLASHMVTNGLIDEHDILLFDPAAAGHDIVQNYGGGLNERWSAEIVANKMLTASIFDKDDIEKVMRMIHATETHFRNGKVIQSADKEDYLSAILCDADLSTLGTPTPQFWARALDYECERLDKAELSVPEINEFIMSEIEFLEGHDFYTSAAGHLYRAQKQANIDWLKTQL